MSAVDALELGTAFARAGGADAQRARRGDGDGPRAPRRLRRRRRHVGAGPRAVAAASAAAPARHRRRRRRHRRHAQRRPPARSGGAPPGRRRRRRRRRAGGAPPRTMTDIRPAWSEPFLDGDLGPAPHLRLPGRVTRRWAYGDGRGAGVRVAVVDSGIDADHPAVGGVAASVDVRVDRRRTRRRRAHRGSARRPLRPRHGVRRDHPLARPRRRAGQRPRARRGSPRQRDVLRRGHRLVHPQRRPGRQPEPVDEQRATTWRRSGSSSTGRRSGAWCWCRR